MSQTTLSPLMRARDIHHRYKGVLALDGVSLDIAPGTFTAILGPNGAGKSTFAKIITGLLDPSSGTVEHEGLSRAHGPGAMVANGICLIPEGRRLFGQLTVEENLTVAGYGAGLKGPTLRSRLAEAVSVLPAALAEGIGARQAASLSGGERQMVALSRALMCAPRLIVVDEPSMGLAPIMVDALYSRLEMLRQSGAAVIVVEQIATHAKRFADDIHLLSRGRIVFHGPARDPATDRAIQESYLG